jgi:hypothetical protein
MATEKQFNKGGRPPKTDPCRHRYSIKLNDAEMEYYARLTNFYSQFRAIGVNYNQVVKHLKTVFTEKMVLALLYKLEKDTMELVAINKKIIELTREFEGKWLQK